MNMNKVPLVLWSGGLDSTYLVWSNISNQNVIDTLYVEITNNEEMTDYEHTAIKNLKKSFKKEQYLGFIRNELTYVIPSKPDCKLILPQAAIWTDAILWMFDPEKHSHVEIGYIKDDDFWHYKEAIQELQKNLFSTFREQEIEVQFPLEWMSKSEIIDIYKSREIGPELLKKIHYCETSKKPCGKCPSCKRHLTAIYEQELLKS